MPKINVYLDDIRGLDLGQTGGTLWREHLLGVPHDDTEWHVVRIID